MYNLKEIIISKKNNIGSLCLYLNKRLNLIAELDKYINSKINIKLTLAQKIFSYINNDFNIFCDCGKLKKWKSFKQGWTKTCGDKKCISKSTINTNIIKYGADNPMKNIQIKNKSKNEIFKKYGVTSPAKNIKIKEKISLILNNRTIEDKLKTKNKRIETWNKKTNEEKEKIKKKKEKTNKNKSEEEKLKIIDKRKNTCLTKYDSNYAITSHEIRTKILKTFNEKFNGNSPFSNNIIKNKALDSYKKNHIKYIKENIIKFQCEYISHIDKGNANIEYTLLCNRTNKIFTIGYSNLRIRIISNIEISPYFRPIFGKSEMEIDLLNFIKKNYNKKIISNSKKIISPLELDIYLPYLKLAFEFNGIYWHNEINKEINYHLNKTDECEKKGIKLIHIYEDDWLYKQDIIKSIILAKLNKFTNEIDSEKCEIKEILDNNIIRNFLNNNHIKGFIISKIKIGLFYNNELVSLMIFSKSNIDYTLLRFCNKINTNIIDGKYKLFNYFIEKYKPNKIITYVDRSISQGNLYKSLGFKFKEKTKPNYYYIIERIKNNKFNFRKDKLVREGFDINKTEHEIMIERKIYRIYDSGNLKFIYNKK